MKSSLFKSASSQPLLNHTYRMILYPQQTNHHMSSTTAINFWHLWKPFSFITEVFELIGRVIQVTGGNVAWCFLSLNYFRLFAELYYTAIVTSWWTCHLVHGINWFSTYLFLAMVWIIYQIRKNWHIPTLHTSCHGNSCCNLKKAPSIECYDWSKIIVSIYLSKIFPIKLNVKLWYLSSWRLP